MTFFFAWAVPGIALGVSQLTGAYEFSVERFSVLSYTAIWSPAIAAFSIIIVQRRSAGLRGFLRRLTVWRGHWGWYTCVIVGIPSLTFLAAALTHLLGYPALAWPTATAGAFMIDSLVRATEGPVEEFGWRGFALPILQQRLPGYAASLILGFVWGLWHVPALFVQSVMTDAFEGSILLVITRMIIGITAKTVIMTVVFNATRGALGLMIIYHWLGNLAYPWEARTGVFFMQDVFDVVVAVVLAVMFGRKYLRRENLATRVLVDD